MKKITIILSIAVVHMLCTLNSSAQFIKLLDFAGSSNGSMPEYSSLISDGIFLYGMTNQGGTNGMGVIFKIRPDGTGYTKLLDFAGAINGKNPKRDLYLDGLFLYGMTANGGTNDMGVIFKIKTDGTGYSKLLDFAGTSNGLCPSGNLISDGTYMYVWSSGIPTGIKMNIADAKKATQNSGANQSFDVNQEVGLNCNPWAPEASKFTVPTNIAFKDMSQLLQQVQQVQPKSTTVTPQAQTGNSPCDQITDPTAKAACANALKNSGY